MSGLEALGAAASIIGVVGALKTCIDLLDIISTARGADLELEHLLVHLQWQRIRFYCWVQETGFTEAIIQDDERPAMQASDMLEFIQDDFRRGHILSHIQSGGGREAAQPKLGLWARIRWASCDGKQLTHLVDTLRKYNTELADLLPFYRMARFERRIGRVLVTTRQLAASLADISSKINTTSDIGTGQFGRQYSLMAQLLESKHQTEVLERDQPKPVDMSNNEHVEALTLAPTIAASQASLNLRASEVRFGRRGTEGFRTREFGSRETSPLIIEWRHYSSEETQETRSSIDIHVHMLAMQLQQLSALHHTGVLPCLGYFHDPKCYRYGIAFHYPRGDSAASPTSLADRLNQDQPRRIRRDLGDRLRAAHSLTGTVYQMLSVNWLHKSISSSNVLLFEVERDSYTVETPFLCGFDLTRRDNDMEPSGKLPSIYLNNFPSLNERLYWHPTRTAAVPDLTASAVGYTLPLTRYRREFDIYSLGVVLLEIGLWYPIKRIFKDCQTEDLGVFSEQLKAKYVPELRGRMGRVYADVVVNCLKGNFGEGYIPLHDGSESSAEDDKELRRRRFLEDFERKSCLHDRDTCRLIPDTAE
ncbi:uncharacterized protein FOBCDRAFT_266471 [Fusarium oxysporum Fo47]|uniref:uncharacterized protein n=1 Tax=Fusarium oxysporum Fo47 TaxID=660027 RepID=UPI00159A65B0|nr:uncharacterized protein FOBCDRAFT_266471 [Fusarium oxysporum Fo47]QKD46588.1 hypothetical protein FOBCDRAFT_266471 [Fusarium oxysporum Fo47]